MLPNFYQISEESFKKSLNYFDITNNKIKYSHQILVQFKDYTNEYCSKLAQLIKDKKNIMDDYIIIDTNDIQNCSKDKNNNKQKDNFEENFNAPIENIAEGIQNFFEFFTKYLTDFMKNFEIQINGIEQYITITKNEVDAIQKNYEKQKDMFKSKFEEYKDINIKLKNNYTEGEQKLIEFCYERRLDGVVYDNNYQISFNDLVKEQNNLIEKYNSLGNYEKIFIDCTKEKMKQTQDYSFTLFIKYQNLLKTIYDLFNTLLLSPMNKLIEEKLKILEKENLEKNFKNNIELFLNNYSININDENTKLDLDKYNISCILNHNTKIEKNIEENKINNTKTNKKEKSQDNKNANNNNLNIINITLTDKEVFFIAKNMYLEYQFINKDDYDLNIEEKKLELKNIFEKIVNFPNKDNKENEEKKDENNHIEENKEITQEEIDDLCAKMSDEDYRKGLLLMINNFRAKGKLELSEKTFNYFIRIFSEICKQLLLQKEKKVENNKNIKDNACSRLIMILSQTFYKIKNNEKYYLCDELKKEKIFQLPEYWQELIREMIIKESKNVLGSQKKINQNVNEKRLIQIKDNIYFSQTVPFIGNMIYFGIGVEEIKKIISLIVEEFKIPEETTKKIEEYINKQIEN